MAVPHWNAGDKLAPGADRTRAMKQGRFQIEIVPADGTRAANWKKQRLRYVAAFLQLSDKQVLEPCVTVHNPT
jgi:hypothetical protein